MNFCPWGFNEKFEIMNMMKFELALLSLRNNMVQLTTEQRVL